MKASVLSLLCLVLLVGYVAAGGTDKQATTVGGVKVDFVGSSGQLKISNGTTTLKLKWDKIEEVIDPSSTSGSNKVESVNNFASQLAQDQLQWQTPVVSIVNGFNATNVTLSGYVTVGNGGNSYNVDLSITVLIFNNAEAKIPYGDTEITVAKNNIKFSISVGKWKFASPSNYLRFGVDIQATGSKADHGSANLTDKNAQTKQLSVGAGSLDIPTIAIMDGVTKTINATIYSKNSASTSVQFIFPAYNSTLYYDPVVGIDEGTSGGGSNTSSADHRTVYSMVAVVLLQIICVVWAKLH
jgi:hypothetical protein